MEERKIERVEVDGMELHIESVDEDATDHDAHTALPPRVESWRRRSVTGAVLTGFAFGLREALEPERQEAPIIVQVSGDPVGDLPVEAHLNDQQPSESVVTVRRWLLREIGEEEAAARADDELPDIAGPSGGHLPGAPGSPSNDRPGGAPPRAPGSPSSDRPGGAPPRAPGPPER